MKILIIDDEDDTRCIVGMSLGLLGQAEVIEAASGREGLLKAAEELPDVIVLDLMMPDMDGAETLCGLRRNPATENIPVIFLTIKPDDSDRLKSLGALAVLSKPFDPELITGQITDILKAAS